MNPLYTLLGAHLVCVLAVVFHVLAEKEKHITKTRAGNKIGFVLLVVSLIGLAVFVLSHSHEGAELIKRDTNLYLGFFISLSGFFIPYLTVTYNSHLTNKIRLGGVIAIVVALGGLINTFLIFYSTIIIRSVKISNNLEIIYIAILAQAIYVASTLTAIGGETIREVEKTVKVDGEKRKVKVKELTDIGKVAMLILTVSMTVNLVEGYFTKLSDEELSHTVEELTSDVDELNEAIQISIKSLGGLNSTIEGSIDTLKKNLNSLVKEYVTTQLKYISSSVDSLPRKFNFQFDLLTSKLDTRIINKIDSIQSQALPDLIAEVTSYKTAVGAELKVRIDKNQFDSLSRVIMKRVDASVSQFGDSKNQFDAKMESLNQNLKAGIITLGDTKYFSEENFKAQINEAITKSLNEKTIPLDRLIAALNSWKVEDDKLILSLTDLGITATSVEAPPKPSRTADKNNNE